VVIASDTDVDVAANLAGVEGDMAAAAAGAGRGLSDITLVAISKIHDAARITPALEAGHRVFGENRVQEAAAKWPDLKQRFHDIELHLVGPLQTNKVKQAVALFDVIETVDRPKLARALAREMAESGRDLPCYVQINTGEEPQKAGIMPAEADGFIALCRDELGLTLAGLMCIPPFDEEPSLHFALLADIARRHDMAGLSMGMSADFETAVRLGATHVRIGTAIFGQRPPRTLS
jgi:hypothetical protein